MAKLDNYSQFSGFAPVTGSIRNALDFQGAKAPHTNAPYSEALIFGVSGGIAFGYFVFHYDNHDPQVNILTRNTFDDWDSITGRMGIVQDVMHSTNPAKAEEKLVDLIEEGYAPIIWADVFTLGYEHSELGSGMWAMTPMVVSEYDVDADTAVVADRAKVGHEVTTKTLHAARARIKKDKFKIITIEAPDESELVAAVKAGIQNTISLFTEKPPKGSANNFGFKAYEKIAQDLTKPDGRTSWATLMPGQRDLLSALSTAFKYGLLYWKDESESADRFLYADFLAEAALILGEDRLISVSKRFRDAGAEWQKLADWFLPDEVPVLKEVKELYRKRHRLFLNTGISALGKLKEVDRRLQELLKESDNGFLSGEDRELILQTTAAQFTKIKEIELDAADLLKAATP